MAIRVDAYTAGGVASGLVARAAHCAMRSRGSAALILERVSWRPLDAPAARPAGEVAIPIDDVLLVAVPTTTRRCRSTTLGTRSVSSSDRTRSRATCRRCPGSIPVGR